MTCLHDSWHFAFAQHFISSLLILNIRLQPLETCVSLQMNYALAVPADLQHTEPVKTSLFHEDISLAPLSRALQTSQHYILHLPSLSPPHGHRKLFYKLTPLWTLWSESYWSLWCRHLQRQLLSSDLQAIDWLMPGPVAAACRWHSADQTHTFKPLN